MTDKMKLDECYLGIELGSTRIKACLTDESFQPIACKTIHYPYWQSYEKLLFITG
mgnify:CR=1 FL=1